MRGKPEGPTQRTSRARMAAALCTAAIVAVGLSGSMLAAPAQEPVPGESVQRFPPRARRRRRARRRPLRNRRPPQRHTRPQPVRRRRPPRPRPNRAPTTGRRIPRRPTRRHLRPRIRPCRRGPRPPTRRRRSGRPKARRRESARRAPALPSSTSFRRVRCRSARSRDRRTALIELGREATLRSYFTGVYGLDPEDVVLKSMIAGRRVVAGTILGRVGRTRRRSHRTCTSRSAPPAAARRGSIPSRSSTAGSCSSRRRSTAPRRATR